MKEISLKSYHIASNFTLFIKADINIDIPLEMAAIFILANFILKQGISSEYVMVDFI